MAPKKPAKWFKDGPEGVQLHAGEFRGNKKVWHSDDGGKTWWSGFMFSPSTELTRDELIKLAVTILQNVK